MRESCNLSAIMIDNLSFRFLTLIDYLTAWQWNAVWQRHNMCLYYKRCFHILSKHHASHEIHYIDVIRSAMASQITSLPILLPTRLFGRRSKKAFKLRVTGLCVGNSPVTGEYPAQRASNAEMFLFDDVIIYAQVFVVLCFGLVILLHWMDLRNFHLCRRQFCHCHGWQNPDYIVYIELSECLKWKITYRLAYVLLNLYIITVIWLITISWHQHRKPKKQAAMFGRNVNSRFAWSWWSWSKVTLCFMYIIEGHFPHTHPHQTPIPTRPIPCAYVFLALTHRYYVVCAIVCRLWFCET